MPISFSDIHRIAKTLAECRGNGRDVLLFDDRDKGNYGGYDWSYHASALEKHDPTGLALGMLLSEMIEATIRGSDVKLERVLREPGFMDRLAIIQNLERELNGMIGEPRAALLDRLSGALNKVSSFGVPDHREVAICLRDAIYSIDTGLVLRWLRCDETAMPAHTTICADIRHFAGLHQFVDALRSEMPSGAHLSRIGDNHTAIGIKQPGKIAYLSSFSPVMGSMRESRARNYRMAESLDLDTAVERYPEWVTTKQNSRAASSQSELVAEERNPHELHSLSLLPRDRLLWLAMVVEMAAQQMAAVDTGSVALVETLDRALPRLSGANLPALIEPNWQASALSIDATFDSFGFADWESAFLRPAIGGLSEGAFFRVSDYPFYGIDLASTDIVTWADDRSFAGERMRGTHVQMIAASHDLTGTREEVEAARQNLFGRNLLTWLMGWGNYHFNEQYKSHFEWFQSALSANLPAAFRARCMFWEKANFRVFDNPHLFTQSPKHTRYDPRCFIHKKGAVTRVAHFVPASSADLIQMLGLKGEEDLPVFLRGWQRQQSWTTPDTDSFGISGDLIPPYGVDKYWCFSKRYRNAGKNGKLEATVCVNDASLPVDLVCDKQNEAGADTSILQSTPAC